MSLRNRVISAVIVIAVTLAAVLVFVTRSTEANLLGQVDQQLRDAVQPVRGLDLRPDDGPEDSGPGPQPGRGPSLAAVYVGLIEDGELSTVVTPGLRSDSLPLPEVDVDDALAAARTQEPLTVPSVDSDLRWRLRAVEGRADGSVQVIGLPLDAVDAAISDLLLLELVGGAVILVALGLVAMWVIRLGVRPINEMTDVATAIAGGDLSQRVPETDATTEAGRLGDALNGMLTSIEASFDERRRVEERLRQFVSDASHELRTPVATIRGYAELYRVGALAEGDDLDDAMRRTEMEAIRMSGLVDDLLSLARLEEGRPLVLAPLDLAEVVRDAVRDGLAVDPDRTIEADVVGDVVVEADEARIRQVVANLVGNALVHTPPESHVTVRAGTDGDGCAFIEVADDGPGMAPEVAARAFERFYRADPSRSRHRGGSGLGLAIVDAVVSAHGGRVDVTTGPDAGTAVRIHFAS